MSIRLPNSCFVHIPRTGGLWLGEVVARLGIEHQVLRGDVDSHFTFKQLPENWRRLKSFGFVRLPVAWIKSRWSHMAEHNMEPSHYRHYGVHRLFDVCFRSTFIETLETILSEHPGLVGTVYQEMLDGVDRVYRTEDLPKAACVVLRDLEGVEQPKWPVISGVNPTNGTSQLGKWRCEVDSAPEDLMDEFADSERLAYEIWSNRTEKNLCLV